MIAVATNGPLGTGGIRRRLQLQPTPHTAIGTLGLGTINSCGSQGRFGHRTRFNVAGAAVAPSPLAIGQKLAIHRHHHTIPLGILLAIHGEDEIDGRHDAIAKLLLDDILHR